MNRQIASSDRGVSIFMVAISLLMLMGAAAIAVDLAAMRLDRSVDQKVTDSAAAAGAIAVAEEGAGQQACEAALGYVEANLEGVGTLNKSGCATAFSASCTPGEAYTPPSSGRFTITVTYPVADTDDALMTSGQLGAPTQSLVSEDGTPCERVGVQMSAVHDGLFARAIGFDQGTTSVHTVALGFLPGLDGPPLNLLVLDRSGCDSILLEGGGASVGEIVVDAVVDPDTGEEFQGVAAVDSDANSGCTPSVIHATGNMTLRADGPTCPDAVTPGTGEGCGRIQTYVQGATTCMSLACQIDGANAVVAPDTITPLTERVTRQQLDHEYNCWGDYTNPQSGTEWATHPLTSPEHNISGCTSGTPAHIYNLINSVGENGPVGGFVDWSSDLGWPCDIPSGHPQIDVTDQNVRFDCDPLIVRNPVVITNGNVIFDGAVSITSSGSHLAIENSTVSPGWAFFRDGVLNKTGQATLTFNYTAVYMSENSGIDMSGGGSGGTMTWVAPDSGDFDDLALWSDSTADHVWRGQSALGLEGVFFMPWARADYSGQGFQNTVEAQWVAHRLYVHGEGRLTLTPKFEFPLKTEDTARTVLIR